MQGLDAAISAVILYTTNELPLVEVGNRSVQTRKGQLRYSATPPRAPIFPLNRRRGKQGFSRSSAVLRVLDFTSHPLQAYMSALTAAVSRANASLIPCNVSLRAGPSVVQVQQRRGAKQKRGTTVKRLSTFPPSLMLLQQRFDYSRNGLHLFHLVKQADQDQNEVSKVAIKWPKMSGVRGTTFCLCL